MLAALSAAELERIFPHLDSSRCANTAARPSVSTLGKISRIVSICTGASGRVTTHYSQAEFLSLIEAADEVCETESRKASVPTWLRVRRRTR